MNYNNILIITYGRTGSTLLQGILNSIEGCTIRGENYNFCYGLFKSFQSLRSTIIKQGGNGVEVTSPFFGSHFFNEETFLKDAKALLENQLKVTNESAWGFKEIRYTTDALGGDNQYQLTEYLDFLDKLLPNSAFIFLTRNHADVIDSAFWKDKDKSVALKNIIKFESNSQIWSKGHNNTFFISYEDIVTCNDTFKDMYAFIGKDFDLRKYEEVMGLEHSYAGKEKNLSRTNSFTGHSNDLNMLRKLKYCKCEFVEDFFVDNESGFLLISDQDCIDVGGVCLIDKRYEPSMFRLILVSDDMEYQAIWDIKSPVIEKKHLLNKNSKRARFSFKGVKVQSGVFKLYIESETAKSMESSSRCLLAEF